MTTNARLELRTVHHVSFRVDDLEESLRFWVGALGLAELPRPELSTRGAWLQAGSTQVHLIEAPAGEGVGRVPALLTTLASRIAFHVGDLDAAENALRAAGHEYRRVSELDQILLRDPTGNVVELTAATT